MSSNVEEENVLFERAKAYLMSADKDGVSVYDQLTRLMEVLLEENPDNVAHDPSKFHELFALLQKHSFIQGESTSTCNEVSTVPPEELQRLRDNKELFSRPTPRVVTTIEQPDPYTTVTTTTTKPLAAPKYDSVSSQNRFWVTAGYGFPEEEAFLLDRSITKLAMEKNLEDVRFVGKIFGVKNNYFIISSRRYVEPDEKVFREVNTMPKPPRKKVEVPVQPEPGYVGCNRLSFWVTNYPSAQWVVLPDVTPQQINAARSIKKLFSGDLDAAVVSSPPFPWNEAVYLRAQLSRIVSGTFIAPQGALEEPEEDVEDDEDEDEDEDESGEPRPPKEAKYHPLTVPSPEFGEEEMDVAQLADLERWVHAEGYIYINGRQTKVPEKPETEEEEEEEEPQEQEEEEEEEPEEEEEEEKELFLPIKADDLYAVVDIPQPPPEEDEEDEEQDEEAPAEDDQEETPEEDNEPAKPLRDEDVADDDVTKMKTTAWQTRVVNNLSKAHRVAVINSLRWPGAFAFAAEDGKRWGCAYFGYGLKKTDFGFTPVPAPPILGECGDLVEVMDPTAAVEKLVRRGEDPPEEDSEDELEEAEEEEEA